jgi:hypothetical protein
MTKGVAMKRHVRYFVTVAAIVLCLLTAFTAVHAKTYCYDSTFFRIIFTDPKFFNIAKGLYYQKWFLWHAHLAAKTVIGSTGMSSTSKINLYLKNDSSYDFENSNGWHYPNSSNIYINTYPKFGKIPSFVDKELLSWVGSVVNHETTHAYFDFRTRLYYGNYLRYGDREDYVALTESLAWYNTHMWYKYRNHDYNNFPVYGISYLKSKLKSYHTSMSHTWWDIGWEYESAYSFDESTAWQLIGIGYFLSAWGGAYKHQRVHQLLTYIRIRDNYDDAYRTVYNEWAPDKYSMYGTISFDWYWWYYYN